MYLILDEKRFYCLGFKDVLDILKLACSHVRLRVEEIPDEVLGRTGALVQHLHGDLGPLVPVARHPVLRPVEARVVTVQGSQPGVSLGSGTALHLNFLKVSNQFYKSNMKSFTLAHLKNTM